MITTIKTQSIIINKQVKDFPDIYDLSTPLNAGVTFTYFKINGTDDLWDCASIKMYPESKKKTTPNRVVNNAVKERLLNDTIKEVIIYKDSTACMIIKIGNTDRYRIRDLMIEDGKWLNFGENGGGLTLEGWREHFYKYAPDRLRMISKSIELKSISTDTLALVDYIKQHGIEPKDFLLEVLAKYPLVIYGEYHRRKVSWDLLSNVLSDPHFIEIIGTIFIEMPAYQQLEFDRFYASKELDFEILLDIMRSFQINGWYDKGQYEFLINIWKLNQTLPADKQIRVVATDEQPPYKLFNTSEDLEKYEKDMIDRNTRMADVIEQTIKTKKDKRNCLFIVGCGHAYKSHVPGNYSSVEGQDPALSAGAQLVQRLSDKNVFTILQHIPMGNNLRALGLIRQGLFDAAFEKNGNKTVAFHLVGSPFGIEPFDADYDICFDSRVGTFADNFDAYIFFQPIKDEDSDYLLYDIISESFIKELKRRAELINQNANQWFDIKGKLTKKKIIKSFKEGYEGKKRWSYLFE